MKKVKSCLSLFLTMLKIGAFTFGGGYAMIGLLENELIHKRGWLDSEEFLDLVTVAESTPGPIAINCATYVGYRRSGLLGAIAATAGMVLPSLTVIYLISLFFNGFLEIKWVASAFHGIRVGVILLILTAGIRMLRKMKKRPLSIAITTATLAVMTLFSLLSVSFSSIFYILISGAIGLTVYGITVLQERRGGEK